MTASHRHTPVLGIATVCAIASGCAGTPAPSPAAAAATPAPLTPAVAGYDPARALGQLFHDVQTARVFPDSKTFVDSRPRRDPAEVAEAYAREKGAPGFSLDAFVRANFDLPGAAGGNVRSDTAQSMEAHIRALWPALTRAADRPDPRSSHIPLPHGYVVP